MDISFSRMQSFVAVVDTGSLTHAAQTLGVTKAMVSMHLKQLEADLGSMLMVRTTRTLALTGVGERFYADCVQVLGDARHAVENARSQHASLSGELRVSSTLEYGIHMVVPALAAFARMHPDLRVDFSGTTSLVNLVADRFDLAIRLGHLGDSGYRATSLGAFDIVLVASPAYIAQHGLPRVPADLQPLQWVVLSGFDQRIKLLKSDGTAPAFPVPYRSHVQADSALAKLHFLLADMGIGVLPEWVVRQDLRQGRLVRLLPDYTMAQQGVYAVFPNTRHIPAKVRQFIDFLQDYVKRDACQDGERDRTNSH